MLDPSQKQNVQYCVPLWVRDEQIRANVKRVSARLEPHEIRQDPIAIVGYGPTLNDTWEGIKDFKYVMTCSGAHAFLIKKGIIPTWHVDVDPREHKVKLIGEPHKDVEYLMASCVHPKMIDLLENFNLKLWHVFAQDNDSDIIIPRGEWAVTGGCDAGMRCMTIARFLGFQDFHIFGIDGSEGKTGKHAALHPNQPKESLPVPYQGKTYQSTPALVECARQVFHELNQLKDVKFKFYGDGLIQHMAKFYERKTPMMTAIAFNRPELISRELLDLNSRLHRDNAGYGAGGGKHAETILKLSQELKTQSILDYGCGKGYLGKALPFPIWEYDPAIPEKSQPPRPAALVVCTDVLEHVEIDRLKFVLDDLKRVVQQVGYFVIHSGAAKKTYADGRNTHLIQQNASWWAKQVGKFFHVAKIFEQGPEIHMIVGPKTQQTENHIPIQEVRSNGTVAKFLTPNDTTKWRAETLLTKEPITIEWIGRMNAGDVLFDVGSNVGGYSVWAGVKGVKVYSFEPEAQNYSLLVQNLLLNNLDAQAFPVAVGKAFDLGNLYLSSRGAGGSCHSFNREIGPDLKPRKGFSQACLGVALDELFEKGLPQPDHIKVDVDGLEFDVIKGAEQILKRGVKSLLVEVNPALEEHREMLEFLNDLGYEFDLEQVEKSTRKKGPFKGVAEHVFTKRNELTEWLINSLGRGVVEIEPFPHLRIENILPDDIFSQLEFPKKYFPISKTRNVKGYDHRFTSSPDSEIWDKITSSLKTNAFRKALCNKFGIDSRGLRDETLLIRDEPGYAIGPHTDHPDKVISALVYIHGEEGTSLYKPREEGFTCQGGPHYSFNKFKKVKTIPFTSNSMFAFLKTNNSFHGVEKTKHRRDVLLYDVRRNG